MLRTIAIAAVVLLVSQAGAPLAFAGQARQQVSDYSYTRSTDECQTKKKAEEEESKPAESAPSEPVGPQPLFFGF